MEQELLTLPEFTPVFSGARVTRTLVLCVYFVDRCLSFVLFLLAIVLSVLLRHTDSDYPFGIFKLFLLTFSAAFNNIEIINMSWSPFLCVQSVGVRDDCSFC